MFLETSQVVEFNVAALRVMATSEHSVRLVIVIKSKTKSFVKSKLTGIFLFFVLSNAPNRAAEVFRVYMTETTLSSPRRSSSRFLRFILHCDKSM
jgi:hypothetical protein